MTCIAALVNPKAPRSWIGSDSCHSGNVEMIGGRPKIWKKTANGQEWLFGVAGSGHFSQTLRLGVELPEAPLQGIISIEHYLFAHFLPLVREAMRIHEAGITKEGFLKTESSILIVHQGIVYYIDNSLCIETIEEGYMAIGSGGEAALSVLWALEETQSSLGPEERLTLAIQGASKYCRGVGGPINILSA
jgi:ATP-dependent protease HslVU (ClpYQ) peptidase subunit